MNRKSLIVLVIGVIMIFFGCSENQPVAPELNQNDQNVISLAKKPAPALNCTITYSFVGHLEQFDSSGRLLVWDGMIHGDLEGQILWWFVLGSGPPNMPPKAHIGFYEARWEIWSGPIFLMAGTSGGQTAQPKDKDGIWNGNGIVTEISLGLEDWMYRKITESGNVDWTFPYSGSGTFRIN